MSRLHRLFRPQAARTRVALTRHRRPLVEGLEGRVLLYSASGNAWPHPQLITISFMPDGTNVNGYSSNLQATFNGNPRLAGWQNQILKATQLWAQQANINFAVVPDNGAPNGSGDDQQGDPGFGDIRIGGYYFSNNTLAEAYMPPPINNFSVAGDIVFNTGQAFNNGTTYDLMTVAAHEFGHALGLYHSGIVSAVMYPAYGGLRQALTSDDIAGIQSIYGGARAPDAYNGTNNTLATAADLTPLIDPAALTALATGLNLRTVPGEEDFTFVAPAGAAGTMTVTAQSQGLSLLAPKVTVYAADRTTVLGSASGLKQYGTTLTVTVHNVAAGQQYYVRVQGADNSAFGTGAYALALDFGANPIPTAPPPNTTTPNGSPLSGGGGEALVAGGDGGETADVLNDGMATITGVRAPKPGVNGRGKRVLLVGTAPGHSVVTVDLDGRAVGTAAVGRGGAWRYHVPGAAPRSGRHSVSVTSTDPSGYVSDHSSPVALTVTAGVPKGPLSGGRAGGPARLKPAAHRPHVIAP